MPANRRPAPSEVIAELPGEHAPRRGLPATPPPAAALGMLLVAACGGEPPAVVEVDAGVGPCSSTTPFRVQTTLPITYEGHGATITGVSADELTAYYDVAVPSAPNFPDQIDIYAATRPALDRPFGEGTPVASIRTAQSEQSATESYDGRELIPGRPPSRSLGSAPECRCGSRPTVAGSTSPASGGTTVLHRN